MKDLNAISAAAQLADLEEVYRQNTAGLTANAGRTPQSDSAARSAGAENVPLQRRADSGDMLIRQYAYDLAAAMLAKGEMPPRATLEAAGIPSADAVSMMMKALQGDLGAAAEHRLRAWNLPGDKNPFPSIRIEGQDQALPAAETGATMEPETDRERADGGIGQPDWRESGEGQGGDVFQNVSTFITRGQIGMIDKNLPQYPAYKREFEALVEELSRREDEIVERQKREHYRQGQDDEETSELYHEINRRLKEIQKKYGFDKFPIEDEGEGME